MKNIADPLFLKIKQPKSYIKGARKADWFDFECSEAKREYMDALKVYSRYRSDENRILFCNKKTRYKKLINKKRRSFELRKVNELEQMRFAKPKDFWNLFRKRSEKGNGISLEDFYKYFVDLAGNVAVSNDEANTFNDNHNFDEDINDKLNKPISVGEITEVVKKK